jgi:hypothetical protein
MACHLVASTENDGLRLDRSFTGRGPSAGMGSMTTAGAPAAPPAIDENILRTAVRRALGQFNGAFPTNRALPHEPFLARDANKQLPPNLERLLARLPEVRDHPYVRRRLPDDLLTRVLRLFDERPVGMWRR